MSRYRVEFALVAQEQVEAIQQWWVEHRPAAPHLFKEELHAAVRLLEDWPELGTEYTAAPVPGVRRVVIGASLRRSPRMTHLCSAEPTRFRDRVNRSAPISA